MPTQVPVTTNQRLNDCRSRLKDLRTRHREVRDHRDALKRAVTTNGSGPIDPSSPDFRQLEGVVNDLRDVETNMLRSIAFCACGSPLYRSHAYNGRQRTYICRQKLEATGARSRPPIPAEFLEVHVLTHLSSFVGSVEGWLSERVAARNNEQERHKRALMREHDALAELHALRAKLMADYERQVAEDRPTAYLVLESVEGKNREIEDQQRRIDAAQARLSEWSASPDVDEAIAFYDALVDAIQGRIENARGIAELNEALRTVLAGLWCEIDKDRSRLLVQFALRAPHGEVTL
jgi:hypothetical protein